MIWIIYIGIVLALIVISIIIANKKNTATQITSFDLPTFIDRNDFENKKAKTLVVVFSSQHCDACETVWNKVQVLQSDLVDIAKVSYQDVVGKKLHLKYQIDAVPSVLICDEQGSVFKSYLGNVTATDLWAGVAELRGSEITVCE